MKNNIEENLEKEENREIHKEKWEKRNHGSIWPLILIFIGTVFLLNNFGILPVDIWERIFDFWPLLLILIGVRIILGKSPFSNTIILIIGLIFIAFILVFSISLVNPVFDQWLKVQFPFWSTLEGIIRIPKNSSMFEEPSSAVY